MVVYRRYWSLEQIEGLIKAGPSGSLASARNDVAKNCKGTMYEFSMLRILLLRINDQPVWVSLLPLVFAADSGSYKPLEYCIAALYPSLVQNLTFLTLMSQDHFKLEPKLWSAHKILQNASHNKADKSSPIQVCWIKTLANGSFDQISSNYTARWCSNCLLSEWWESCISWDC